MVDLSAPEIPKKELALALRRAVETGQAKKLRFEWEITPAGEVRYCLRLEGGALRE